MYLVVTYYRVAVNTLPLILDVSELPGIRNRYAEGQALGLPLRTVQPRMAPAGEESGTSSLSEVQEPVLEYAKEETYA
jgi:hypothetical protein